MIHKWTKAEEEFMLTNYPLLGCKKCAAELGIEAGKVKAKASNMKLSGPRRRPLTTEELNYFMTHYANTPTAEIAARLGVSESVVYHLVKKYGVRKSKEYIAQRSKKAWEDRGLGRYSFRKGNIPFTKGRKQVEWMSPEGIEKTSRTRFKVGEKPKNWRPVGSERVDINGYVEVKVEEGLTGWRQKHRVVWENANGPIPKGYNVMFKDGNRQNCTLENLHLVSNEDKMKQNTIHRYPQNLIQTMRLGGYIKREINKQLKQ